MTRLRPGIGEEDVHPVQRSRRQHVVQHDAVEVLRDMLAPASLDGVHLFFPDPWPKTRHHKRRLLQPAFLSLLVGRLRPGAYIHCATDWEAYAQQMLAVLSAEPRLRNTATDYVPRPDHRPPTRFERRGLRLGHVVRDLVFRRQAGSLEPEEHRQDQLA